MSQQRSAPEWKIQCRKKTVSVALQHQGQWVAVLYDDRFYIEQVVHVINKDKAFIIYLEQTSGRSDYFKWSKMEDLGETFAYYIFHWYLVVARSRDRQHCARI